jgi:hypothetical protein
LIAPLEVITSSALNVTSHSESYFRLAQPSHSIGGAPPCFSIIRTLEDHDQAVRGFTLLQGGSGFVSVANDGTAKVRDLSGSVLQTYMNPVSPEGKPYFCFGVASLTTPGCFATCNEDLVVRIYGPAGKIADVPHPGELLHFHRASAKPPGPTSPLCTTFGAGTPWAAAGLPNGDLATASGQASRRNGHVYVWSADPARGSVDDMVLTRFATDMVPPPPPKAPADDESGSSGAGSGGLPDGVSISGPYESRDLLAGSKDGAYGFFRRADGAIMVCAWSSAAGIWTDVGTLADGDDVGMTGSSEAAVAGKGKQQWDYVRSVTMETPQGMRSLQLCFNDSDDPNTVASAFLMQHSIGVESFEEVRNFILQQKASAPSRPRAPIEAAQHLVHLPIRAFAYFTTVDWKKVLPKLTELNSAVAADADAAVAALACTSAELESLRQLSDVLAAVGRYHASSVPVEAVRVLFRKLLRWPLDRVFPAVDFLRVLLTHPDGADAVVEEAGKTFLKQQTDRIAAACKSPALKPVVLLTARALGNSFSGDNIRAVMAAGAAGVLDCASDLLKYDNVPVKAAACTLLHNLAHLFAKQLQRSASSSAAAGPAAACSDHVDQLLALVGEGLGSVAGPEQTDSASALLAALGTVVLLGPHFAGTARDLDLSAAVDRVRALLPPASPAAELAAEVLDVLRAR